MEQIENKRERVLETGSGSGSRKPIYAVAVLVVVALVAWLSLGGGPTGNIASATTIEPVDYAGLRVDKQIVTPVEDASDNDLIGVKLSELEEYRMVFFKHAGKPILMYADQYGNIITTISVCEPCKNEEHFFIQDNLLVCGKCFTKWQLGSHTGVSGGCKMYPPAIISHEVKDGNVYVSKAEVENWRPRV